MAQRYGGKYSPDGSKSTGRASGKRARRTEVDPAGGRANLLFIPAVVLVATNLGAGALSLLAALLGAGAWTLAAWLLRGGLRAEAQFNARKVARRPTVPRKLLAAALTGIGTALAVIAHVDTIGILSGVIYGIITTGLHLAAFGIDPLHDKGMEGIDTFQQDRVARVVDQAETHLATMAQTVQGARDREAANRLAQFSDTARDLIRTVEEDPRDLTAARKYLGIYLQGARDATAKFADIYARTRDAQAKADYLALLDDLDQNFAARNTKSLLADRSDLTVEIEVLRDRLAREGVQLDRDTQI